MKNLLFTLAILTLGMMTSCSSDDEKQKDVEFGTELTYISDCKSTQAPTLSNGAVSYDEYITFTATTDKYLNIKHVNHLLSCCFGNINVKSSIDNDIITIQIIADGQECNCVCPYDMEYKIGPLEEKTYVVSINGFNSFTINFSRNLQGTQILETDGQN